jgi:hypothetical protein
MQRRRRARQSARERAHQQGVVATAQAQLLQAATPARHAMQQGLTQQGCASKSEA